MPYKDPEIRRIKARKYTDRWRKKYPEKVKEYRNRSDIKEREKLRMREWRKKFPERNKEIYMAGKRRIQEIWGRNGDWRKSEQVAINFLSEEKFIGVKSLNYPLLLHSKEGRAPFDVRAEKEGKICVFLVTTGLQTRVANKYQLAKDLGVELYALFIKPPELKRYILKKISKQTNYCRLTIGEVKKCVLS